jgi:hypothetical protein
MLNLRALVAASALAAVVIAIATVELGLFSRSSTAKPSGASPAAGGWEEQTVRHGLEELRSQSNRGLPDLALTETPPEPMPPAMRRKVHETIGPSRILGLDFDHAQLVQTQIGIGIWIAEGRGVTCAFRDGVGSSICQTSVQARRRGLLLETYRAGKDPAAPPTHFVVLGIAPNWAHAARVKIGGRPSVHPIVNHAYAMRAHEPIEVKRLLP